MNTLVVICETCDSRALVACIACGQVCCLKCALVGEICACGHSQRLHGPTEHMRKEVAEWRALS